MKAEVLEAIKVLINEGYIILQVLDRSNDGGDMFFAVFSWQESYFNTTASVDYNTVEGIDLTDFIETQSSQARNHSHFITLLNTYIDKADMVRVEFSKNIEWVKYAASGRSRKMM